MESGVRQVAIDHTIWVPEIEGGYRLGLGRFYAGEKAGIGCAFQASSKVEDINGGTQAAPFRGCRCEYDRRLSQPRNRITF